MALSADRIATDFRTFLGGEVEASTSSGRVAVLTPIYNLERDGVVVWIEPTVTGYRVTDLGEAAGGMVGEHDDEMLDRFADEANRAFDTAWEDGVFVVHVEREADLPEAVMRVAQASAHLNGRLVTLASPIA